MNRLYFFSVLIFFSLAACKPKAEIKKIPFENALVEPIIMGYIKSIDTSAKNTDVISVDVNYEVDEIKLIIANTYPIIDDEHPFNGIKNINGYRIAFTGEKIKNYDILNNGNQVPDDIKCANIRSNCFSSFVNGEYSSWLFEFADNKLVSYTPKSEIDRFLKIN